MTILRCMLAVVTGAAIACGAGAQAPQPKVVRIVNPFAAGGNTGLVTRALIERLTPILKQQFIIDESSGRHDQYCVGVRDKVRGHTKAMTGE